MTRRRTLALLAAAALVAVAPACSSGSDEEEEAAVPGRTLTLYSSLPLSGPSAPVARAVLAGQRQALADARSRAGGYRVKLVALDSSRPGEGGWNPAQVEENAKRAADDRTTVAYLGELDLGASAVSIPITSSAGVAQVSPGDGLTSLTRVPPARPRALPERLYPDGVRNFLRLVPNDLLQARALIRWAEGEGARRIVIVNAPGVYGDELAAQSAFVARRAGMAVIGPERVPDAGGAVDLAQSLVSERPDAVVYTAGVQDGTVPFLDALNALAPRLPVFASSAVTQAPGALGRGVVGQLFGVKAAAPRSSYPSSGRRVLRVLSRGRAAARVEALYGYESVALVLDAVEAAGSGAVTRTEVRRAAVEPRRRRSVIGAYEIRPRGDVTSRGFTGYVIRDGELRSPVARPPRG